MLSHEYYMQRCLELAQNGRKSVSPNPMVGAVIVCHNHIMGEGFHSFFGGPHAEVVALSRVKDTYLLPESTLYVNLEPCAHFGKTPPCANLIVDNGIRKVVIGTRDIFAEVNGKGVEILRNAGIEVIEDVLHPESIFINRRFFTFHRDKRPYIILKWAQSADGFLARPDYTSKWISNKFSRLLVHQWRSEESAILVGHNTALYDNPQLNSREMSKTNPVRILLDRDNTLAKDIYLKDESIPTIVFTQNPSIKGSQFLEYVHTSFLHDELILSICHTLYEKKLQSLIIEGGRNVLSLFINSGLWDEARVFTGNEFFIDGIKAPILTKNPEKHYFIEKDNLNVYYNF